MLLFIYCKFFCFLKIIIKTKKKQEMKDRLLNQKCSQDVVDNIESTFPNQILSV